MKAMAAVTIRQYEQIVEAVNKYDQIVTKALHIIINRRPEILEQLQPQGEQAIAAIVLGSEIGMCGQFNEEIADFALEHMKRHQERVEKRRVISLGLRLTGILKSEGERIEHELELPGSPQTITSSVQDLVLLVENWRLSEGIENIFIYYNQKESGSSYAQKELRIWPPDLEKWQRLSQMPWPSRCIPSYRSDLRTLISEQLRQSVFVTLYKVIAESLASENASRLAAMQAAENNIEEHLAELKTRYNHQRQSSITAELLDIASGFEALRD
jgi:F-type H+-transporting ATPase subunit gamma